MTNYIYTRYRALRRLMESNDNELVLKYGGEEFTRGDLVVLRTHYLNLMSDLPLLVQLAAGAHISLFDEYAFAKREVRMISQALDKAKPSEGTSGR